MTAPPPGCERLTAPPPFEVWRIDLMACAWLGEHDALSDEELARAERFAFEVHRRRYLAAHRAMRELLARRTGAAQAPLSFAFGPFGKPHLASGPALAFNLSDSEEVALLAMADGGEIGVDVEVLRPVPDATELAALHFTPTEREQLATTPDGPPRDRRFLTGWTRKEACLKAIGSGLSIGALTFEAGLDEVLRQVRIRVGDATACVEVQSFDAGPDCVAALARCIEGAGA